MYPLMFSLTIKMKNLKLYNSFFKQNYSFTSTFTSCLGRKLYKSEAPIIGHIVDGVVSGFVEVCVGSSHNPVGRDLVFSRVFIPVSVLRVTQLVLAAV